jgi:hypothetical protein
MSQVPDINPLDFTKMTVVTFPDGKSVVLIAETTPILERAVAKIGNGRIKFSHNMVEDARIEKR